MAARKATRTKQRQPQAPEIEWHITGAVGRSKVDGYPIKMVQFSFRLPDHGTVQFALSDYEAEVLREEIGRAYDELNGT